MQPSPQATGLASSFAHCLASGAHPVPLATGGYVWVDSSPMLAAAAMAPISAVLVLPRADDLSVLGVLAMHGVPRA